MRRMLQGVQVVQLRQVALVVLVVQAMQPRPARPATRVCHPVKQPVGAAAGVGRLAGLA